jgi:hypothetical protein
MRCVAPQMRQAIMLNLEASIVLFVVLTVCWHCCVVSLLPPPPSLHPVPPRRPSSCSLMWRSTCSASLTPLSQRQPSLVWSWPHTGAGPPCGPQTSPRTLSAPTTCMCLASSRSTTLTGAQQHQTCTGRGPYWSARRSWQRGRRQGRAGQQRQREVGVAGGQLAVGIDGASWGPGDEAVLGLVWRTLAGKACA